MRTMRLVAVTAAAAIVLFTAACDGGFLGRSSTGRFATGTTMDRINKSQKLRVGSKFDQPGFGMKGADGQPEGFDAEIAKIIGNALGIDSTRIEWTETSSTVREQVIERDAVDIVVATYTITDKRKAVVDFAGPYYVAQQSILVNVGNTSITGPESFGDGTKTVCSATNSTPAANIRKYLKDESVQLVLLDIYQKCIEALQRGRVDAVTSDNVILTGFLATNKGQFKLVGPPFGEEPYGIGLKKGDTEFRNFINDALEKSFGDGSYNRAWRETAGRFDPVTPRTPEIDRY